MNNTEQAAILERSADLIDTVGHAKGVAIGTRFGDDGLPYVTGYCLMGALSGALEETGVRSWCRDEFSDPLIDILAQKIEPGFVHTNLSALGEGRTRYGLVADWNDAAERTPSEVSDLLKRAAKDLRNTA